MKNIILNADVGEEAGFDADIMPYISWCNIACGSHAGNDLVIQETIRLAMQHGVKIGAHPSYPDRQNFGRVKMEIAYKDLVKTITEQIQLVKAYTEKEGGQIHHVKPHGALYNEAVKNKSVAMAIIESIKNVDKSLSVVTLKNDKFSYLSDQGIEVKYEAFADRNYNDDIALVSRSENRAVLTDPKEVFEHVKRMVCDKNVKTKNGVVVPIFFDTICVHGDNPESVRILKYLHKEFSQMDLL
ncbi:5-oxoprolinase subunit PxpA [Aquimarina aquimarini]|uniref:5-oxoprolinase subunit PxpA n=1 Tax=Aquimarina aquimarini TaxID=1191734 RepID=UPI000D561840|nr:5-oxoprolinase subunit PxpA [Aquimarina aquimarini]